VSPQLGIYILWVLWMASWAAAALWRRPTAKRAPILENLTQRLIVALGVVLLFGLYSPRFLAMTTLWGLPDLWGWLMVVLVLAGFGLCWWARLHLGDLWSSDVARKADHRVIESGPYAFVRHPIYTGLILAAFASAAEFGTAAALLGACLMALGWYLKARFEERFLIQELGPGYDDYRQRVAMLVPFVKF